MATALEKYEFYLRHNPDGERIVELISISHSAFTEVIHLVREPGGLTLTLEDTTVVDARGVNMEIKRQASKDDLDERFSITIADEKAIVQDEAIKIPVNSQEKIRVDYRVYMSDNLNEVAIGPFIMEAVVVSFNIGTATIEAQAPSLTETRTGELYTYERFPALRAFL